MKITDEELQALRVVKGLVSRSAMAQEGHFETAQRKQATAFLKLLLARCYTGVSPCQITAYFVQDYVAPSEGPMASEVSKREFFDWARANPDAQLDYDGDSGAMYLRLDLITAAGLTPSAPKELIG